jgi:hypothetical protein
MVKSSLVILLVICNLSCINNEQKVFTKETKENFPRAEDVETLDGLMKASYEVVSGEKGTPRQWQRDMSLHHPNAVYSFPPRSGEKQLTLTLEEFHGETDKLVLADGFFESEIAREVFQYGNMAHVLSSYETRTEKNGPVVARGINSIQLYNDGKRWWIVSWVFDREKEGNKIPAHLDHPKL